MPSGDHAKGRPREAVITSDSCHRGSNSRRQWIPETAVPREEFISRCRKASIRREFPGSHLDLPLGTIKKGKSTNGKKAWKLLNDNPFKK